MRITLLGGTGFVGHQLVAQLSRSGHELLLLTRNAAAHRDLLTWPNLHLIQTDVYQLDNLARYLQQADAVINLVGILNERGFSGRGFRRAHVELVQTLIQACVQSGTRRLLHMSALRAGEGSSHYLITRGEAERIIADAAQEELIQPTVFQSSVIFGAHDTFINRFAGLLKLAPVLPLARPHARFQPVWVNDVAQAFTAALTRRDSIGRTYQLAGPTVYELLDIVRYIAAQMKVRRWIIPLPDTLAKLQAMVMNCVPGKPFSTDNYRSLLVDNVASENGLAALGITPHAMETIVPQYLGPGAGRQRRLDRYRHQRHGGDRH